MTDRTEQQADSTAGMRVERRICVDRRERQIQTIMSRRQHMRRAHDRALAKAEGR